MARKWGVALPGEVGGLETREVIGGLKIGGHTTMYKIDN